MDRSERIARLKAMLQQVAPENQVEAIAAKYEKPPGGLESMESPEAVPVRRGLEKVMGDRDDLSPPELDGLEAIVMPREQPVVFRPAGAASTRRLAGPVGPPEQGPPAAIAPCPRPVDRPGRAAQLHAVPVRRDGVPSSAPACS